MPTLAKVKSITRVKKELFTQVEVVFVITARAFDEFKGDENEIKLVFSESEAWHLSEELEDKLSSVGVIINDKKYVEWFKNLWSGTTSKGKQQLYGFTEELSLIRIYHLPVSNRLGGTTSGVTEWVLARNYETLESGHGFPKAIWKKTGRLTREDKSMIEEKYKVKYGTYYKDLFKNK